MDGSHAADTARNAVPCLALLAVLAITTSCSSSSQQAAVPVVCPVVMTAPGADSIAQFAPGGGRQVTDVRIGAKITSAKGTCRREEHGVAVDADIGISVTRAGNEYKQTMLPYFVAVTDYQRHILAENYFQLRVDFAPGELTRPYDEKITAHLPLKTPAAGGQYIVVVGFQLTADKLEFNRSQLVQQQ